MSTTITSTPASTRVRARLYDSSPTPIAAATRSRPASSLVACGYCSLLVKSLTVISPRSRPPSSTSGSFSTLCWRSSASASSLLTPTGAVTSGIVVMTSRTEGVLVGDEAHVAVGDDADQLAARASTTGTPEIRYRPHSASTSRRVSSGEQVTGLVIMPASERLTRSTWLGLVLDRQVAVQHADAALAGHGDRHPGLGDGVHRAGDQRDGQLDVAGEPGAGVDRAGTTSDSAGCSSTSSKVSPSGRVAAAPSVGSNGMSSGRVTAIVDPILVDPGLSHAGAPGTALRAVRAPRSPILRRASGPAPAVCRTSSRPLAAIPTDRGRSSRRPAMGPLPDLVFPRAAWKRPAG